MKVTGTTIRLTREDAMELCLPGEGANTCIWLVADGDGFECIYYRKREGRNLYGETLEDRWLRGDTVAKRDGCDTVRGLGIQK